MHHFQSLNLGTYSDFQYRNDIFLRPPVQFTLVFKIVFPFLLNSESAKQNCSRRHFYFSYLYLSKKIRLDVSCETSA